MSGGRAEDNRRHGPVHVTQCATASTAAAGLEARMGNKDKGAKNTKKAAAKGLKEKRAEKRAKKSSYGGTANQ